MLKRARVGLAAFGASAALVLTLATGPSRAQYPPAPTTTVATPTTTTIADPGPTTTTVPPTTTAPPVITVVVAGVSVTAAPPAPTTPPTPAPTTTAAPTTTSTTTTTTTIAQTIPVAPPAIEAGTLIERPPSFTGSNLTFPLTLGGVAIIGAGVVFIVLGRRRDNEAVAHRPSV